MRPLEAPSDADTGPPRLPAPPPAPAAAPGPVDTKRGGFAVCPRSAGAAPKLRLGVNCTRAASLIHVSGVKEPRVPTLGGRKVLYKGFVEGVLSPAKIRRDRQQWKCEEITAAVLCFKAQDLDRLGTRIKYSEGICRRGDQARPPRSVHRKRCRARAELPCEHPPSQSHRLSSLVAGNGWSPERRGERVSHRPMERDDAGLRLPDSKDPGERRRFTSSYDKNPDSAEWTTVWVAREKPEQMF
ncbi:hypothetical protein JEQ12_020677 [Ovis aries]|uniref:Uncharacterized protein n=1 Tax=Ovis aries TaxID=9940 RepID=A0A836CNP8_SHEEP|nr:hypothetical protein JEQ12_020677 [Ovis aries]